MKRYLLASLALNKDVQGDRVSLMKRHLQASLALNKDVQGDRVSIMKRYVLAIALLMLLHRCAIKPIIEPTKAPTIRVGIMEAENSIEFLAGDNFNVFSSDGTSLTSGANGDKCLVTVNNSTAAEIGYQLLVKTVYDKRDAERTLLEMERSTGLPGKINPKRQLMVYEGRLRLLDIYQICLEREFDVKENAEGYRDNIRDILVTTVIPFIKKFPSGIVSLKNLTTGRVVESKDYLQVVGNNISFDVKVGSGFHFEDTVTRTYAGGLNFVVDRYGKLTLVNELPIEDYLSGVVPSEMNPDFPLEALKAQAVTARGYTLSRLGKQHPLDPFDVCDDVHCQAFSGITKVSPSSIRAVEETEGQVLMYQDEICETFYSAVCGGHTEHNENVWGGTPRRYLRGIFDLPEKQINVDENFLLTEENVRKWVEKDPRVYCNINLIEIPAAMEYTRKYFHWQEEYSASELRQIIIDKTGQDVGNVLDIIPLQRGISGRLMKIRIEGTTKSIVIEKELEIRKALSRNYLYSSCFIVDKESSFHDVSKFIIKGAGWGHGVGMCQTGAAVMALKGISYDKILKHYYRGTKIEVLY